MDPESPFRGTLPPAAEPALRIVRTLAAAGHQALLAGGCVRDLLLGHPPQDYDVATAAPPERVCALFRATRKVGVQFGVVLVRQQQRWVEVATFRSDGDYLDGRRPAQITLSDAEHDARRRDFTVNGMFLDPLRMVILDYVGGQVDLAARVIRAIGEPNARFDEDYLRLLRAVRFAARLEFPIEPVTLAAIRAHAPRLAQVAAERVHDELTRMLAHPGRLLAWRHLRECELLPYLWPGARWRAERMAEIERHLGALAPEAPFELAMAILLADARPEDIERIAGDLTLSNNERDVIAWLVLHQAELDDPRAPTLAQLKRVMAGPAFAALAMWARARYADLADRAGCTAALDARVGAIAPEAVQPPPLITGADLLARSIPAGPAYKEILDELYTRQLDEQIRSRDAALAALEELLREHGYGG